MLGLDRDREVAIPLPSKRCLRPWDWTGSSWSTPTSGTSTKSSNQRNHRHRRWRAWPTWGCRRSSSRRRGGGFSFRRDEPLDMRMDRSTRAHGGRCGPPSMTYPSKTLADRHLRVRRRAVLPADCPQPSWQRIAAREPLTIDGASLPRFVRRVVPRRRGRPRIDPATRTFQALRTLGESGAGGVGPVSSQVRVRSGSAAGARLAVITFHSLEDRIVKTRPPRAQPRRDRWRRHCAARCLTKRPLRPGARRGRSVIDAPVAPSCGRLRGWRE